MSAVRTERRRRNWTQSELAETAGFTRAVVASLETGTRELSLNEAVALCQALGLDLAALLGLQANPGSTSPFIPTEDAEQQSEDPLRRYIRRVIQDELVNMSGAV
jgi:transcriptional regulator with XRE-family HTH domain